MSKSATPWTAAHQASLSFTISQEFAKIHVRWVGDVIQPSHPLLSPSPLAFNHSQHQGLFKSVSSIQSLSCVRLFATWWTAAHQASLSIINSQSLVKLMSIESVMPSNHLIHPLSSPSPSALNLSQHQGLFLWLSSLHQVAKVLEFQLQYQPFQWIFRADFL